MGRTARVQVTTKQETQDLRRKLSKGNCKEKRRKKSRLNKLQTVKTKVIKQRNITWKKTKLPQQKMQKIRRASLLMLMRRKY